MNGWKAPTPHIGETFCMGKTRTPASKKAGELAKLFRKERPNYFYLKEVFKHLRHVLEIKVTKKLKKVFYVPSEEEITRYCKAVRQSRNMQNMILVKTMLYTSVRVGELIRIKLSDVDLVNCHIRINCGKGGKDRTVLFPKSFKGALATHVDEAIQKGARYLFESSWKRPYSDRGIRKILAQYTKAAKMRNSISPHKLRHFLFTWMKKQGVDDAFIQPYSGHECRKSLEIYSKLSIMDAQKEYDKVMGGFPI